MIHARNLHHVVDVVDQIAERRTRQLGRQARAFASASCFATSGVCGLMNSACTFS